MNRTKDDLARQRAQEIWDKNKQQDETARSERDIARQAEATKTARLRELRLSKEAADKAAERTSAARPRRRTKVASAGGSGRHNDLPSKVETTE